MKICVLSEYFYPDNSGGTPTDLSELASYLKRHHPAAEIDVVTSNNLYRAAGVDCRLASKQEWQGIHIRRLTVPKSNRPSTVLRLAAGAVFSLRALLYLVFRPRYDVLLIVTNPPANGLTAWAYRKLRGVPFVYLVHDLYPDIAVAMGKLGQRSLLVSSFRRLQRAWLTSASQVVSLGRCMRRYLHEKYQVPLRRISVITSWADPEAVTVQPRDNEFRRSHSLKGFLVVYAGNFSQYVNFDQVLDAAKELGGAQDDIDFVLVGDGVLKTKILDRIARENLSNVRVLPRMPRSAIKDVLAAADACLISLDSKMGGLGVPSKLYANLASGRPTIAIVPQDCEVARVINEEECGCNIAEGDSGALADAVRQLKARPDRTELMGANARSTLERRFTLAHSAEKLWAVLNRAAGITGNGAKTSLPDSSDDDVTESQVAQSAR